jgi:hypothetical protein
MLNVTKRIDQTLAHVDAAPQNGHAPQQHQQHQPVSPTSPPGGHPEEGDQGPFIASMNELKQHASKRRSRRSLSMQQRWSSQNAMAMNDSANFGSPVATIPHNAPADAVSSLGGSMTVLDDATAPKHASAAAAAAMPSSAPALPEHYIIAEQLLRVHKTHVDQIMETLKIEMDTLRDFEQSLEQEQAPTPDQVLDYFESVGLCLDQRTTAGNILQREMDRISKGGAAAGLVSPPPNNNGGR